MATNAITAMGVIFTFDGETVGEVMSLTGTRTRRIIEILSCDSTNEAVEKIAGALNEGDVTVHIVYDGSAAGVYNKLNTKYQDGTKGTLLITYPDTSNHSVDALISALGLPAFSEPDGSIELDVTLALSGSATYTDVA